MMIKKGHNTVVSDGIKKFLMENLIKNLKSGALSRHLIKSIKILSRTLKKRLIMSKNAPYQKNTLLKT